MRAFRVLLIGCNMGIVYLLQETIEKDGTIKLISDKVGLNFEGWKRFNLKS